MDIPTGLERRTEDYNLITGNAHYVDDIKAPAGRPALLHMVVVRSMYAHATINMIDVEAARALPGITAVLTGAELVNNIRPADSMMPHIVTNPIRHLLALDKVRYMGDPVAVILAENRYVAEDARDLVEVDCEPLPAVVDPEAALTAEAALLYAEIGSNQSFLHTTSHGAIETIFAQAAHTIQLRILNQRLAPSSIEPRVCLFDFDAASGQFSAWLSSQSIYRQREVLADFLGLARQHVQVYNAEVGGAFGAKNALVGEELLAAQLAVHYQRPVKWTETRGENLQAQTHGRGQINYIKAAFQNDGRLLGLKVKIIADLGAFLVATTAMVPLRIASDINGPYQLQAIESQVTGVFTNKVPTAAYRGAGRPEATYILERVMDRIAHELSLDPVEVRRRNLLTPAAFPYTTVAGIYYDSGNYQLALDRALTLADYAGWRKRQRERRATDSTKLLGIGLSTFTELTGDGRSLPGLHESAIARIRRDGSILIQSGVSHNGQGYFTAFAQIAAATFQHARIEVQMNDTALPVFSIGTYGSRITQVAASAVLLATEAVRAKAFQVAAHLLEAAPDDLELENGRILVRGVPTRNIPLGELARMVEEQPELVEQDTPHPGDGRPLAGLTAWRTFAPTSAAYASGTHIAVIEIDSETGELTILAYTAVDDGGHILNHDLAEAQLHGALAQGIGQALHEEVVYDEEGQLLTSTLMDYALPFAGAMPEFVTQFVETPSPTNPLGVKGVGEAGCIAAPPTLVNAALDALAPQGIQSIDMPLTPMKIWSLIEGHK